MKVCLPPQLQSEMVVDMVRILGLKQRFAPRYAALKLAAAQAKSVAPGRGAPPQASAGDEVDDDDGTSEDGVRAGPGLDVDDASDASVQAAKRSSDGALSTAEGSGSEVANNAMGGASSSGRPGNRICSGDGAAGEGGTASMADVDGASAVEKSETGLVQLRKRLREGMVPTSDVATWTRVRHELTDRGGFQPLMPWFSGVRDLENANGNVIPWGDRDREMPSLMGKISRQAKRLGKAP